MTGRARQRQRQRERRGQRGAAAIEFAFVLLAIFTLLYGVATFGAVFYTQQALARAAEDGARAALLLTQGATPDASSVSNAVYDSLAASLLVPLANSQTLASRRAWIAAHVVVGIGGSADFRVTVAYPYGDNRLLPTMPLVDASRWMPDTLYGRATVAIPA